MFQNPPRSSSHFHEHDTLLNLTSRLPLTSSDKINIELRILIHAIFQRFFSPWYNQITHDTTPPYEFAQELFYCFSHIIQQMERKLVQTEWILVLSLDLPFLLQQHLKDVRQVQRKLGTIYGGGSMVDFETLFLGCQPHAALENYGSRKKKEKEEKIKRSKPQASSNSKPQPNNSIRTQQRSNVTTFLDIPHDRQSDQSSKPFVYDSNKVKEFEKNNSEPSPKSARITNRIIVYSSNHENDPEKRYLSELVDRMMISLLPEDTLKSSLLMSLLKEILVNSLMIPLLDTLSDPIFWIHLLTQSLGKIDIENNSQKIYNTQQDHRQNSNESQKRDDNILSSSYTRQENKLQKRTRKNIQNSKPMRISHDLSLDTSFTSNLQSSDGYSDQISSSSPTKSNPPKSPNKKIAQSNSIASSLNRLASASLDKLINVVSFRKDVISDWRKKKKNAIPSPSPINTGEAKSNRKNFNSSHYHQPSPDHGLSSPLSSSFTGSPLLKFPRSQLKSPSRWSASGEDSEKSSIYDSVDEHQSRTALKFFTKSLEDINDVSEEENEIEQDQGSKNIRSRSFLSSISASQPEMTMFKEVHIDDETSSINVPTHRRPSRSSGFSKKSSIASKDGNFTNIVNEDKNVPNRRNHDRVRGRKSFSSYPLRSLHTLDENEEHTGNCVLTNQFQSTKSTDKSLQERASSKSDTTYTKREDDKQKQDSPKNTLHTIQESLQFFLKQMKARNRSTRDSVGNNSFIMMMGASEGISSNRNDAMSNTMIDYQQYDRYNLEEGWLEFLNEFYEWSANRSWVYSMMMFFLRPLIHLLIGKNVNRFIVNSLLDVLSEDHVAMIISLIRKTMEDTPGTTANSSDDAHVKNKMKNNATEGYDSYINKRFSDDADGIVLEKSPKNMKCRSHLSESVSYYHDGDDYIDSLSFESNEGGPDVEEDDYDGRNEYDDDSQKENNCDDEDYDISGEKSLGGRGMTIEERQELLKQRKDEAIKVAKQKGLESEGNDHETLTLLLSLFHSRLWRRDKERDMELYRLLSTKKIKT